MTSSNIEDNYLPVIVIQLMRLYDLQFALLAEMNPERAVKLAELHERGFTIAPAPAYRESEQDDEA